MGVAPEAEILSVSTWLGSANPGGKSDQDQIPEAVRWAVDNGAKVINISLGSTTPQWPQSWDAAFLYAEQKDVVIVAAAGNRVGGNVQVGAPATIPGVLTVAGLDRKGAASVDSSSQGISIGVAAPAENLIGGLPGGGYAEWAGTSGATPIVAGVAALIRSKWPEMSAKQVINRIVTTAKDAGAPGKDPLYGFGVLNAEAALKDDVSRKRQATRWVPSPTGSGSTAAGTSPRPAPVPTADVPSAVPTLPEATVPAAEAPSQRGQRPRRPRWSSASAVLFVVHHCRRRRSSCAGRPGTPRFAQRGTRHRGAGYGRTHGGKRHQNLVSEDFHKLRYP